MGKNVWCVVVALVVSCGGGGDMDGGPGIDGSIDAPVGGPDGSPGIDAPVGGPDGSIDAPVPACSDGLLTGSCFYAGYGTMCPVPCSFPETCSFDLHIGWTGNYCCLGAEQWVDCRCVDGTARCARYPGSTERVTPTTTCEFCEPPDAGG